MAYAQRGVGPKNCAMASAESCTCPSLLQREMAMSASSHIVGIPCHVSKYYKDTGISLYHDCIISVSYMYHTCCIILYHHTSLNSLSLFTTWPVRQNTILTHPKIPTKWPNNIKQNFPINPERNTPKVHPQGVCHRSSAFSSCQLHVRLRCQSLWWSWSLPGNVGCGFLWIPCVVSGFRGWNHLKPGKPINDSNHGSGYSPYLMWKTYLWKVIYFTFPWLF